MQKEKLIEKRKERGFSQEKMADLLGLDTSNYSRRENGETNIKITEWEKIAQILGVALPEIYESEESLFYQVNSENKNGAQIGDNNTIVGADAQTLENLNEYIKSLKEENALLRDEIKSLKNNKNSL